MGKGYFLTNVIINQNVGIGTTTPNYKLHCIGDGCIAGSLITYNFLANSVTSSGITKTFKYLELTGDTAYGVNNII